MYFIILNNFNTKFDLYNNTPGILVPPLTPQHWGWHPIGCHPEHPTVPCQNIPNMAPRKPVSKPAPQVTWPQPPPPPLPLCQSKKPVKKQAKAKPAGKPHQSLNPASPQDKQVCQPAHSHTLTCTRLRSLSLGSFLCTLNPTRLVTPRTLTSSWWRNHRCSVSSLRRTSTTRRSSSPKLSWKQRPMSLRRKACLGRRYWTQRSYRPMSTKPPSTWPTTCAAFVVIPRGVLIRIRTKSPALSARMASISTVWPPINTTLPYSCNTGALPHEHGVEARYPPLSVQHCPSPSYTRTCLILVVVCKGFNPHSYSCVLLLYSNTDFYCACMPRPKLPRSAQYCVTWSHTPCPKHTIPYSPLQTQMHKSPLNGAQQAFIAPGTRLPLAPPPQPIITLTLQFQTLLLMPPQTSPPSDAPLLLAPELPLSPPLLPRPAGDHRSTSRTPPVDTPSSRHLPKRGRGGDPEDPLNLEPTDMILEVASSQDPLPNIPKRSTAMCSFPTTLNPPPTALSP